MGSPTSDKAQCATCRELAGVRMHQDKACVESQYKERYVTAVRLCQNRAEAVEQHVDQW